MKKVVSIILAIAFAMGLVACQSTGSAQSDKEIHQYNNAGGGSDAGSDAGNQ